MYKPTRLVELCQQGGEYWEHWEKEPPKKIDCPHLKENSICEIASEIANTPRPTTPETCRACMSNERPQRLNIHTLTIAGPNVDISHIQSVIDGTSTGFGTRLQSVLGVFFRSEKGCGCNGHKDILDVWTPEYIRENLETVIEWLHTEARNRRIPFSRFLVRQLLESVLARTP
jgi:hypothetical protein